MNLRITARNIQTKNLNLIEEIPNPIGTIPAVNVYNLRGAKRPIGISDLADVAYLQQSIYNDYSEKEQLIRLANHPSWLKHLMLKLVQVQEQL